MVNQAAPALNPLVRRCAVAAFLLAALSIPGCHYNPLADEYTRDPPPPAAVAGTWVPDVGREYLGPAAGGRVGAAPSLVLKADGTFVARQVPDWWDHGFAPSTSWAYADGSGKWTIRRHQEWWVLKLHFTVLSTKPRGFHGMMVNLFDQEPPYRLGATLGDPDDGRALMFHKVDAAVATPGPGRN